MREMRFEVENIKCGGCSARITRALRSLPGVQSVQVDPQAQSVVVAHEADCDLERVAERLKELGYPRAGSATGLSGVGAKARSVVSCAIGRLSGDR
ncbi:MAG: heavy-metal-associated domain-containing protein [Halothiobacillaceae bacterium]